MAAWDFDFIVIGSGFGGSVSALRLVEKGYSVAVIEKGKRYRTEDFARSSWNLRKYLWSPSFFCHGMQAMTRLRDAFVFHGVGVGGGSLVYANTLLVPPDEVFEHPNWRHLADWRRELAPHFAEAKRMLGVTQAPCQSDTDQMIKEIAEESGRGDSFYVTPVGVYFGEEGKKAPDPYFGGRGPERQGCIRCGACMVGCRHNAKNTLDKNYLYLAEAGGAEVFPQTEVRTIGELAGGGYELETVCSTNMVAKHRRRLRAPAVVVAAGVLGSVSLLLRCKEKKTLPRLSVQLGNYVRTNSEAILAAVSRRRDVDYSKGIAVSSGYYPTAEAHVEVGRFGAGQDFMAMLTTVLVGGGKPWPRWLRWLGAILRRPSAFARSLWPFGFGERGAAIIYMQPCSNHMRLVTQRRWWWPFGRVMRTQWHSRKTEEQIPKYFPQANEIVARLAEKMGGEPRSILPEVLFNLTTTAHLLGGCLMGANAEEGVIDHTGRVFGHDNLYVADGSIVPVNLSVNPSLTITALSEWVMAHIPDKSANGRP